MINCCFYFNSVISLSLCCVVLCCVVLCCVVFCCVVLCCVALSYVCCGVVSTALNNLDSLYSISSISISSSDEVSHVLFIYMYCRSLRVRIRSSSSGDAHTCVHV